MLDNKAKNNTEKGFLFEKVVLSYLKKDNLYKNLFKNVWLWKDWPDRKKYGFGKDVGIDIVAQGENELCPIQCKFHTATKMYKSDIDSFLELSSRKIFNRGIIFHTFENVSNEAQTALSGHDCTIVNAAQLAKSEIDWPDIQKGLFEVKKRMPFRLRTHQKIALKNVISGFLKNDRGKMIMACGTGKTFTSLKIAEEINKNGGLVLYLVPSISLMRQSIREWSEQQGKIIHKYIGVCSDTRVGNNDEDISLSELEIPVTTNADKIALALKNKKKNTMMVVFSTYQSIKSIQQAMMKTKLKFDLILCDEAHRTTGIDSEDDKVSSFVIVHDDTKIPAMRRLYMTATPRIYSVDSKKKAQDNNIKIYSMDGLEYGNLFYEIKFTEAIDQNLLSDYKVIVLNIDEQYAAKSLQNMLRNIAEDGSEIKLDDVTKMIGCWIALNDPGGSDKKLQKAIAFTNRISDSKKFAKIFPKLIENLPDRRTDFVCDAKHIDGRDNALSRSQTIQWLEDTKDESVCHVVSNAKCLTEGVDVPALDAILFLNPRNSMVDVVQAVGRVMRKSPNKNYGYIIIPVVIPAGIKPQDALNDNKRYETVWKVLNALRSHDDFLDISINQIDINNKLPKKINWIGIDKTGKRNDSKQSVLPVGGSHLPAGVIYAKLVDKVGDRRYFEDWAEDVVKIVDKIQIRIKNLIEDETNDAHKKFNELRDGLRIIINESITDDDTVDVLSQHIVTRRIFDALFTKGQFISKNIVSVALDNVIKILYSEGLENEIEQLEQFYVSVERRIKNIDTHEGRQKIIKDLYGRFFEIAFPKLADKLGIVYTPIEIVDFILRSVDYVLKENFNRNIESKNTSIIDAFVGTGSFITRLFSDDLGLINDSNIERKYKHELYANEIVLLAYYIAAVNCESTYGERTGNFEPFNNLVLTDTFHSKKINEQWDENIMSDTMKQIDQQRKTEITVIVGNPPYSKDHKKHDDGNKIQIKYKELDERIKHTYESETNTHDKKGLHDSYIRAIRWATDRIGDSGVIAFVTNASFIRRDTFAGVRAYFNKEFTDIWCYYLRGDKKIPEDGRNIFEYPGQSKGGTTLSTAIIILVKNPKKRQCTIRYASLPAHCRLGAEKRLYVKNLKSIQEVKNWEIIKPDTYHDWFDKRVENFYEYIPIGSKSVKSGKSTYAIFKIFSLGVASHRDVWTYNTSQNELTKNIKKHMTYCLKNGPEKPINYDYTHAHWTDTLTQNLKKYNSKNKLAFDDNKIRPALYRPFFKQKLYFDKFIIDAPYKIPFIFPEKHSKNLTIIIPYKYIGQPSVFITDITPDLEVVHHGQCFPLYIYEKNDKKSNITDYILNVYQKHYSENKLSKKDIFYYVYGMLHHLKYKKEFRSNLMKDLPHIPLAPNFWKFSNIGKKLIDLHLNFNSGKKYDLGPPKNKFTSFQKLSFGVIKKNNRKIMDKTKLLVDNVEIFDNLPNVEYTVNGKTPIGWIVDRYNVTTNKKTGITNNPCDGVDVLSLIEQVTYVGIESDKLIKELSKEEFKSECTQLHKTNLDAHL